MHLRAYYQLRGGHIHVRVFSGSAPDQTHGLNGHLVFGQDEWPAVRPMLAQVMDLRSDDVPVVWPD